ncbi:2-amino-4-hydroxy-6-hydroxymethyldihydropteridine diphosphokinase [Curtobacterium sp. Leaf261]|uniref:2-amino-4-hydroxy-6- hydroxymethyldihydropteridine diphosphokinase n=1 Tax=Curtobacterium sp. Leaf261 TaxID=1736311 RepID=UPI000AF9532B|nr:2-amino-4-hydroxy-6-hydroxymethyldihydropteridine diphosphokinase [Curtobacterium sp. Leaf261]
MSRAVIALGANLGDRGTTLRDAATAILGIEGVRAVASSHEVESIAVTLDGPDDTKPRYRNGVVIVDTDLGPSALLDALHRIEDDHGRVRIERWGDRTLDLDIVAVDDLSIDTADLELPHPRAGERAFVLAPWVDADPDAVLPGAGSVRALLDQLGDDTVRVDEPRLFSEAAPSLQADSADSADGADSRGGATGGAAS